MTDAPSLVPYNPNCTLHQVAQRLSTLGEEMLAEGTSVRLAQELHVAALCCFQAHARWQDLLETLENYRLERIGLESWLDGELAQMKSETSLGPAEDLSRLRPDAQGRYAWDRWQAKALAAGLSEDLAGLGRAVIREAVQHDWVAGLQAECGWSDDGQAMLELAQRDAAAATRRWTFLLETDGLRGRWTPDGEWQSGLGADESA